MPYQWGTLESHRDVPTFDEMTSPDVASAIAAGAHIMVPAGATEQHGRHLPLGSDTMQGVDIAKRCAFALAKEDIPLILGPAVPFGPRPFLSESPRAFPGTVNITNDTLKRLLEEICAELVGQGFRTIYLLLANAESDPPLQIVAKEMSEQTEANVMTLNWLVGIRPKYKDLMRSDKIQGHGGEGETHRMLATAPHLVRMDQARPYHPKVPPQAGHADILPYLGGAVGRYKFPPHVFEGFEDGITGDPQLGTAETGEQVYALVTDWICGIIREEWRSSSAPSHPRHT